MRRAPNRFANADGSAIRWFVALLARQNFHVFAYYCWAVGALFILVVAFLPQGLASLGGLADLAKLAMRAMLGGTLAAFMTATVAGILV